MRSILLSFSPDWFERIKSGEIKFEYRKSLPEEPVKVFYYVSSPIKAITGISFFSNRQPLITWLEVFKNRPKEVIERINNDLKYCNYVVNIDSFQSTNEIALKKIKLDIPDFIVPRMYYYIDGTPLEKYLETNLVPTGTIINNSFEVILDKDICAE